MQTNYNEVVVLMKKKQGGNVLMKKISEKSKHIRDRDMSGNMKRLKRKMEVQVITLNYFARPQTRDLNFIYVMMMMVIQKILLSVVSKFVLGLWDGLDECEISRPQILSQSTSAYLAIMNNGDNHSGLTHSSHACHHSIFHVCKAFTFSNSVAY